MDVIKELMRYSFHATWDLKKRNIKPFKLLEERINRHIREETHATFVEEGLLFQSYLYMSGIDGNVNIDKAKSTTCLNKAINKLNKWNASPEKDGFLSIVYALDAWVNIDLNIDKTESRIRDLQQLYFDNRNETRKPFEAAVHFIKGYSLSRLGAIRYVECMDEYRQATEKCPENYDYLFSLAFMTRRCDGAGVKKMLSKVLEMKPDYLYAKAELASLVLKDGNTTEAVKMLEGITTTLKDEESITPENMNVLGKVMNTYLQMKDNNKVKDTYKLALISGKDCLNAFVIYQRAQLAKNLKEWSEYKKYLEDALKKNPVYVDVKVQLARETLRIQKATCEVVKKKCDMILNEHEGDECAQVNILFGLAKSLFSIQDTEGSIIRHEKAVEIALNYWKLNFKKNSNKIKFTKKIKYSARFSIKYLRKHYTSIQNSDLVCKLAKFEHSLGNAYLARSYCKDALKMTLGENQKYEVSCILAEIEIDLSADLDSLKEVDVQLNTITPPDQSNDKLEELRMNLNFKTVTLFERPHMLEALSKYYCVAKTGHKGAIMRLFSALEIVDESSSTYYEIVAMIEVSIRKLDTSQRNSMQGKLKTCLETAVPEDLRHLRDQELEMEKTCLEDNDDLVGKIDLVIQTSRNLLNAAMNTLSKRYCKPTPTDADKTIDFFCIDGNFDVSQTENKIREMLKNYKWHKVDDELITFLVEIQPCTSPRDNNWIMAFMEFNNINNHKENTKKYFKCQVYPEEDGAQPGIYQDKEYYSIDLARKVCDKITYILDNLNGFSLQF